MKNVLLFTLPLLFVLILSGCKADKISNSEFNGNSENNPLNQTEPDPNLACQDGISDGTYPCQNIDLLAHLPPEELLGTRLNDIWGWTDPQTGREYALVGLTDGVSFVDVSDPAAPVVVGKLLEATHNQPKAASQINAQSCGLNLMQAAGFRGQGSVWRDMKVYDNHLFVVSDGQDHGMQVFDLAKLRDAEELPVTYEQDFNYDQVDNTHNIAINEQTGFAYAVGATNAAQCDDGGLHMIDINSPLNPEFAGCFAEKKVKAVINPGYVHDAHCVVYDGPDAEYSGREVCFNASETALVIADVTEKGDPQTISFQSYDNASYSHQGWLTEDHSFYLLNDELDENAFSSKTQTYIWDVRDLDDPKLIGSHKFETSSIDHNLYVKGNFVYESNYTSGLRILNIEDIENGNLEEVAFFDTFPLNDARMFDGAWSNYPFFESGTVIVSDISNGLFILKPSL